MPQDAGFARPRPEGGEPHANGDGEPRRRRRGRRGGRRNRRDREGGPNGDLAATQGQETHERTDFSARPDWSPPREASLPETAEPAYAPRIEPEPRQEQTPQPAAASPQPAADRELLRAVSAPTMILCQEGDELHPVEIGRILADVMPNSELVVIGSEGEMMARLPELVEKVAVFLAADG